MSKAKKKKNSSDVNPEVENENLEQDQKIDAAKNAADAETDLDETK
ncbi:MAG: hypothetical protein GX777_10930, partial [Fastidiosipila sp.]|nr:hypothetical protein [Fastidiosipila sp.]